MTSNNKNQNEETSIDKLDNNLKSASQKIAENKKRIFMAIGGVAIVAAAVIAYIFLYRAPRENRAFEAFHQVELALSNDSVAAAEYAQVADKYSGTDAGKLAALSAAEHYYNLGKYKEALAEIEKFSTKEPVLEASALVFKGDILVNLKKYDEAISAYNKAISKADENVQIVPRTLLKEANVYDEQKKFDKALECYETIQKDYPTFQLGNGTGIEAYIEREKARLGK